VTLGTDGFGRSDNREYLRRHFEVNAEFDRRSRAVAPGAGRGGQVRQQEKGAQGFRRGLGVNTGEKIEPSGVR